MFINNRADLEYIKKREHIRNTINQHLELLCDIKMIRIIKIVHGLLHNSMNLSSAASSGQIKSFALEACRLTSA